MVLGIHNISLLHLPEVKGIITAHYEAEQGRCDKGHTTQKLSAVKRKPTNEPTWQGSAPNSSGSCPPAKGKAPYKKTQRGNRGSKSKQQQKQQRVHLVTIPRERAGRTDCPERMILTKKRGTARTVTRQRHYEESTFLARLAKALRRHGMAVCTTRTSSSMMRDITDQLARLAGKRDKDSSNEDVPAQHGPCGPERPPRC
jgi:hypothetical protein